MKKNIKKNNKKIEKQKLGYKEIILMVISLIFVFVIYKICLLNKYKTEEELYDLAVLQQEDYEIKKLNETNLMDLVDGVKIKKLPDNFISYDERCKIIPYMECESSNSVVSYTLLYDGTYETRAGFTYYATDMIGLEDDGYYYEKYYHNFFIKNNLVTRLDVIRYLKSIEYDGPLENNFFTPVYKIKENYIINKIAQDSLIGSNDNAIVYELIGDYNGYVTIIEPRNYITGVIPVTSTERVGFKALYLEIFKNNKIHIFTFWNSDQGNVFNESNIKEYLNSIVIE